MFLTNGDFLYPFTVSINNKKLQIRLFNLITVKEYNSSSLRIPIRTNYLSESLPTYFKYFSLLACWKKIRKKPLYRIDLVTDNDFFLLRLTDINLHRLRKFINYK